MARIRPVQVGLALAIILVASPRTLTADEKCKSGCQGSSSTFKYAEGTTYKYNYESSIDISLSTAEGQQTTTKLKATVFLTQLPQCNQILRLQNVQVIGSDGKKYGHIEHIEKPIRLNFNDGRLDDVICVESGETQNSLNVKRAIASIFQTSLKNQYETDVFGLCPTEVSEKKEGGALVIQRNRNLNKCAYRESIKQDFLATAFNLNSEIKSSPILNGDYVSQQRIKNGILDQATVTENYLYVPFSVGKNGAKAIVQSKLQYVSSNKETAKGKVSEPRSIIFENPHPVTAPKANVNSILAAVKTVTDTIDQVVSPNSAKEFVELVKIIRESKKDDLLGVYNQVRAGVGFKNKEIAKKVFLDALLRAGTGEVVEVAIELLKNKELNVIEEKLVYLGLSFVKHATKASLSSAAALLDQPNLPREAYLGVGTLAGRFCREHSCKNVDDLNKLIQKLIGKLGDGKAANRQEENEIIYSLKAIANIRHLSDTLVSKVVAIAQDNKQPSRLRVTALETYLADPCKDKIRDSALHILKDTHQDSEIRIKAYLVLAQCPNGKVANAIKSLLEQEPSYQVGGFIVSHLRNIRASANPDKQLAKQQLGLIGLPTKFPFDFRKYSFNGEFSYAIDTLGIANAVETNVIYSQNSYLPRSTNLNLTAELFGHSFNFLEIATRQENLDRLVEHYFGPLGVFKKDVLRKIVKRDVSKAEIESLGKQVQIKRNELNADLDLDLSVKLFGSEFLFLNLNEDVQKYSPESIADKIFDYLEKGVEEAKNFEKTIRNNLLFLDAELGYPTSLGFPLRLAVEGSSAVQIKAAGSIDLRALRKLDNDVGLKLTLIPSANIEISGRLTIDAQVVESGLKVSSTVYSAIGGDSKIDIFRGAKGFDAKFSLPVKEQKLISATHDIVFTVREQGQPEKSTQLKFSQNNDFSVCFDQLNSFIGVTACGEINGPNLSGDHVPILPFPLSGNAKYVVTLEKEDVSQYHFRVSTSTEGKVGFDVIAEALGDKGDRKVALEVEGYLAPEKFLKASLVSPVKSAVAEVRLNGNDKEKSALVRFQLDKDEYYAKAGVQVSGTEAKAVYKPILEYRTPADKGAKKPPYNVEGQIVVEQGSGTVKYIFDNIKINIPNQKPVEVKGNFIYQSQPDLRLNVEFQNSYNPTINFDLKYELKKLQSGELQNSLQLIHGRDLSSKTNIITLSNSILYNYKSVSEYLISSKNKFKYPLVGVSAKLDFEGKPKSANYELSAEYKDLKFGSELDFTRGKKSLGDYDLDFEVFGLNNRFELESKREVLGSGDRSKIENSVELNGRKLEVTGTINHKVQPQNVDVGSDLVIKVSGYGNPIKLSSGFVFNANEADTNIKISSGSNNYVDFFFKAAKGGNANGSLKVNVKEYLNANGQLKAVDGVGGGDFIVEFIKLDRKIKGELSFTIKNPNYNVEASVYPSFGKDPSQKFAFSTTNKVTDNSLDSKNYVEGLGQKVELNAKGSCQGKYNNGKTNGEVELVLPYGYGLVKYNRDIQIVDEVANGNFLASFEYRTNKNAAGRKLSLKGTAKDTNIKADIYDVVYNFEADLQNGKTLNSDLYLKRTKDAQGVADRNVKVKLYGSVIPNPLEASLTYKYDKESSGSYKFDSSYGSQTSLTVDGEFKVDVPTFYSGKIATEIKSPYPQLTTFKFKADGSVNAPQTSEEGISLKGKASLSVDDEKGPKFEPISGEGSFSQSTGKVKGGIELEYAKSKVVKADVSVAYPNDNEFSIDANLATPNENAKNVQVQLNSKKSPETDKINNELIATSDGKKYVLTNELVLSESAPSLKVLLKYPTGKEDQLYAKVHKITDKKFDAEVKVVYHPKDFEFDGKIDADLEDIEDFSLKVTVDSPFLKLHKTEFEAFNKGPVKGNKRIQFSASSEGKNILSGSTSYKAHVEGNKYIVEGSGTVKVKDESKSANFKYIRQNLSLEKNGERGIEISFDGVLGSKAVDSELKVTNKQFRILGSYCEEKKQCAHVEVDSKTTANDVSNYNNELEIAIDLRKLGLSHEFGLKAVTVRKQLTFDHSVDVHFQNQENSKYQYSVYVHPKKAGVSLTTPKRIIAGEGVISGDGPYTVEAAVYLDKKNNPRQKSAITGVFGVDKQTKKVQASAEFSNPALKRPLRASFSGSPYTGTEKGAGFELVVDIFPEENKKVIVTGKSTLGKPEGSSTGYEGKNILEIKSQGLNIDIKVGESVLLDDKNYALKFKSGIRYNVKGTKYDSGVSFSANTKQVDGNLKLYSRDLLKFTSKLQLGKDAQTVETIIDVYGGIPTVSVLEVKNYNTLKYTLARKDNAGDRLEINSGLIPGQIADFRVDGYKGGAKNEFARITVKLDDANFLKTDYAYNSNNVQKLFLIPVKEAISNQIKEVRELGPKVYKEFGDESAKLVETFGSSAGDFKPLKEYYTNEAKKIREEILQDKTIKEINEFLKGIIGAASQTVGDILAKLSEILETAVKIVQGNFAKVLEIINKELFPRIKEIIKEVADAIGDVSEKAADVIFAYLAKISKFVDDHQEELKQIATSFNIVGQDLGRFVVKAYETIQNFVSEQLKVLVQELKAVPILDELKVQYEQLIKSFFGSQEQFLQKLDRVKNDVLNSVKEIISNIIEALNKFATNTYAADVTRADYVPFTFDYLTRLPRLVAIKFSPLTYLLTGGWKNPVDLFFSFSLNPKLWVPPIRLDAIVVQGQHIFTFDGKHLTFPGKCDYLLARDALEGNFSIVGTYTNGLLSAITLSDKSNTVTLKKGGQVLYNNAPAELPVLKTELFAFRDYESITLLSIAGAEVVCGPQLVACGIHVSGFYYGRIRGLLGNGNFEPFDDFTLPNGKIASSDSDFGNAYKLSSKCSAVKAVDHHAHHPSPTCAKLFGYDSPLRYCYKFVDIENYKTACEHGLAGGVKDTEFAVAVGYTAACSVRGVPVKVPEQFVECTNAEQSYKVGEKFSVKTPGKAADIILLVSQDENNEVIYKELVQPLVQQLNQDLNSKGVNDIEYHLVTWGGDTPPYPHHITVGGKLTFKGKAPNIKFSEPEQKKPCKIDCDKFTKNRFYKFLEEYAPSVSGACPAVNVAFEKLASAVHDVNLVIGNNPQAKTYQEGLKYPFRSNAIKSVIAVTSSQCEEGKLLALQVLAAWSQSNSEVSVDLITPLKDYKLKDTKQSKDVVGFNDETVFTLSQGKKKPEGNSELLKQLEYSDFCSTFTVKHRGNVFIADNFVNAKGNARKQYLQIASHNIADRLTSIEKGYDCECKYVSPFSARNVCKVVYTKDRSKKG